MEDLAACMLIWGVVRASCPCRAELGKQKGQMLPRGLFLWNKTCYWRYLVLFLRIHLMDVPLAGTCTGGALGIEDDEQTTESLHSSNSQVLTYSEVLWTIQMINYNLISFNENFNKTNHVVKTRQNLDFRCRIHAAGKPLPELRRQKCMVNPSKLPHLVQSKQHGTVLRAAMGEERTTEQGRTEEAKRQADKVANTANTGQGMGEWALLGREEKQAM